MMKINKRSLLYTLIALLLISCASTQAPVYTAQNTSPGGIGGTGIINYEGIGGTGKTLEKGIGGTGKLAQTGNRKYGEESGGIGGTGIRGTGLKGTGIGGTGIRGTGIVGTITAFGSIWVDQTHVHFDEDVPITINQQAASSGELQLGQVVAVVSEALVSSELNPESNEQAYQAQSIDIIHEVVGPVSQFSASENTLEVLQQTIHLAENAVLFSHQAATNITINQLTLGDNIEVSGLRQTNGEIIASRLDILPQIEQVQLIGELVQTEQGLWSINNQAIAIDELLLLDDIDKRVLISGQLNNGIMIAEAIGIDSVEMILDQVAEIIYEGNSFDMHEQSFHEASDLIIELDSLSEQFHDEETRPAEETFYEHEAFEDEAFEDEAFEDEAFENENWESENYYDNEELEGYELEGYEAEDYELESYEEDFEDDYIDDEAIDYDEIEPDEIEPDEYWQFDEP